MRSDSLKLSVASERPDNAHIEIRFGTLAPSKTRAKPAKPSRLATGMLRPPMMWALGPGCLKAGLWYDAFLDFNSACAFMGKAQLEMADSQHRLDTGPWA